MSSRCIVILPSIRMAFRDGVELIHFGCLYEPKRWGVLGHIV
jgi:hypothetical protein